MSLTATAIVTNYNYGAFLGECLDALLAQTRPLDRIVVVDDGSSDDSRAVLAAYAARSPTVRGIEKVNGGQLSCFNLAPALVGDDDAVFFVDADDLLPENYVARVLALSPFDRHYGFLCADARYFGSEVGPAVPRIPDDAPVTVHDVPRSSDLTRVARCWIGAPTSAIVMAGWAVRALLPVPIEREWRIRADDVLVYGTSLLGIGKRYAQGLFVNYRVHGANGTYNRQPSVVEHYRHAIGMRRLFAYFEDSRWLGRRPHVRSALADLALVPADAATRARWLVPSRPALVAQWLKRRLLD